MEGSQKKGGDRESVEGTPSVLCGHMEGGGFSYLYPHPPQHEAEKIPFMISHF